MKWLFSILLIANLGMFIWLYPQQDDAAKRALIPGNVGDLRLIGEETGAAQRSADGETVADVGQAPATQDPELAASAQQSLVPSKTPAAEPADTPKPPKREPEEQAAAQPATPHCGTLGVFEKRSQAELVSVRLLARGGKTEITAETSNDQAGYWVLIPPQANRTAAINIAKELEAAGVSDLWRFTSGQLAHAISLGLFRDEERAQARSDSINEMGFESEVRPRFREKTRYWVNYRYQDQSSFQDDYWQELKASFPALERSEQTCP